MIPMGGKGACGGHALGKQSVMKRAYDVGAYLWPSYHHEPRVAHFWPEGDGEWYTVRRGTARFPGHDMPRVPLLGYQDEADPRVMRQHVELALAHGINVFIVDWYWYANAPCFERQLNEGLIPALQGTDARFYLMWANHDVDTLWNMHVDTHWGQPREILWRGQIDRAGLEPMFDRLMERYFKLDCYYRIGDKPVFSIYETKTFIAGLGGVEPAAAALTWMRDRCETQGLPGLHLQTIGRNPPPAGGDPAAHPARRLGYDSGTAYQFCMDAGSTGDYVHWARTAMDRWPAYEQIFKTWFPHVSIGWDNTQRNPTFGQEQVVTQSTPEAFEACLWRARAYLDARPDQAPLVTLNSWNEWTEGSYLLPDLRWGYAYLRAVRNVFGPR